MSAFAGESSAALVCDGRLAAAANEELFAPGAGGVPWRAAARCLESAGVKGAHLDAVALAHKPLLAAGRIVRAGLAYAPSGWERFGGDAGARAADLALGARLRARLGFKGPLLFVDRTSALAASACAGAGFERSAVVLAGVEGEWADCALAVGDERGARVEAALDYPHSIARLCDAVRQALGVSWDELAVLAEPGQARLSATLARELADFKEDGSHRLDMGYFSFSSGFRPYSERLSALVRAEPAADVAASTAAVAGDVLARMGAEARRLARADDVCVGGLLARWPAALAPLRRQTPGRLFIAEGLAADGAVGAAVTGWSIGFKRGRVRLEARAAQDGKTGKDAGLAALSLPSAAAALAWRALLAVIYFALLTPYSLLLRLVGVEFLEERFSERASYWTRAARDAADVLALRRRS